ncbi:uncharacterized protein EI90DRAFT_3011090 [Cantharellus anzutake]|uniref:uncharacterized protein n=1 Tax=Cantharellus anzutake TaxID=1750568 RepID=UPI00190370C4|nr:uncharacterized protein EI90DRAFT_3011090 [Cantharellus anzutake]KAF8342556.1 hypothetical protein EI90DRAFT_3011090 [Cantharellus anzutake]
MNQSMNLVRSHTAWLLRQTVKQSNVPRPYEEYCSSRNLARKSFGIRHASTGRWVNNSNSNPWERESPRITVTRIIALSIISYGLWEVYQRFTVWPSKVRSDLRAALKAQRKNDYKLAAYWFRKALDEVKRYHYPEKELGKDYRKKISGLMIALASTLEEVPDLTGAIQAYKETITYLRSLHGTSRPPQPEAGLTPRERHRIVSIAVRLGELASKINDTATEEHYLSLAVEETLRLARDMPAKLDLTQPVQSDIDPNDDKWKEELQIPPWIDRTEFVSVFERLAEFYGRQGNLAFAVPLYIRAISSLFPSPNDEAFGSLGPILSSISHPSSKLPSPTNICRAAQLMTNVACLFATAAPRTPGGSSTFNPLEFKDSSPEGSASSAEHGHSWSDRDQARIWASRATEVAQKAINDMSAKERKGEAGLECGIVLAHALHSVGMLSDNPKEEDPISRGHWRKLRKPDSKREWMRQSPPYDALVDNK